MKVAIVHDWLNTKDGGAEQVLRDILSLPTLRDADLFTLVCDRRRFADLVGEHHITTSFLQRFPAFIRHRPRFLLPFIRRAVKRLDLAGYDLIISSSGSWVKNLTVPDGARHICYCYTPARMIWDEWPRYVDGDNIRGMRFVPFLHLWLIWLCGQLRQWDYYGSDGVEKFLTSSHYVAGRIEKFYHRDGLVIHPGIEVAQFTPNREVAKSDYFVVVSTLARYKNIDLIIEAFRQSGHRLIITGDGADRNRLEGLASGADNIEFRGFVDDATKVDLLQRARAFIMANVEDFGIAPIEALAAGTPVIGLRGGGLSETIEAGETGVFFDQPTAESLRNALNDFEQMNFRPAVLHKAAQAYTKARFRQQFSDALEDYGLKD